MILKKFTHIQWHYFSAEIFLKNIQKLNSLRILIRLSLPKKIQLNHVKGIAAIASALASHLYSLDVLAENIQTIENNETRFVVLERSTPNSKSVFDKASIKFELDHKRGSLATILNVLSDCKMNLTKIQSMPKIETPWRYSFFVDITFQSSDDYFKAKSIIEIMAKDFKVLGEYKNSKND
jgi:prephenate dehydratase